jgi:hypothetical protein
MYSISTMIINSIFFFIFVLLCLKTFIFKKNSIQLDLIFFFFTFIIIIVIIIIIFFFTCIIYIQKK